MILKPEDEALWLDPSATDQEQLVGLFKPYPSDRMDFYPVSTRVNYVDNDSRDLIKKV